LQDDIRAAGATYVAISPQTAEKSRELIAARKLNFPLLQDEANVYAAQYNLLNRLPEDAQKIYLGFGLDLAESNGESSWTLPIPGTYVIDQGGVIRYAAFAADYTHRPEPEALLPVLRGL
jgi:peroxiredoxin